MSKFPVASKPLARLSNRIPDNNLSDYGRISSAGLLQPDEQEGNEENLSPCLLGAVAWLHYEQVSSRLQALGLAFQ